MKRITLIVAAIVLISALGIAMIYAQNHGSKFNRTSISAQEQPSLSVAANQQCPGPCKMDAAQCNNCPRNDKCQCPKQAIVKPNTMAKSAGESCCPSGPCCPTGPCCPK